MTEAVEQPSPVYFNNSAKAAITLITYALNVGLIAYLAFYGEKDNSLHTSLTGWAYTSVLLILLAMGVGSLGPNLAAIFQKR
jgi:hypothetical protein